MSLPGGHQDPGIELEHTRRMVACCLRHLLLVYLLQSCLLGLAWPYSDTAGTATMHSMLLSCTSVQRHIPVTSLRLIWSAGACR